MDELQWPAKSVRARKSLVKFYRKCLRDNTPAIINDLLIEYF